MAGNPSIAAARRRGFVQGLLCGILVTCTIFQFAHQWPNNHVVSHNAVATTAAKASSVNNNTTAPSSSEGTRSSDTTVIVTSSLIPSHPSLVIIKNMIQSVYTYIRGLDRETTKLIIIVDGIKNNEPSEHDDERYGQMVENLHGNFSYATILPRGQWIGLNRLVQRALKEVDTKYIYLLQHDLLFSQDIDHKAIVKTMEEYPDELQIVRFNQRKNERLYSDNLTTCFDQPSVLKNVNGIHFTRAGSWSDNNQFATKSYYNTLFAEYLKDSNPKHPMEWRMGHLVAKNCSLAPFLYGAVREGPYLTHLDGRQSKLEDLVEYN